MSGPSDQKHDGQAPSSIQPGIPLRVLEGTARVISGDFSLNLVESTSGRWYYRFDLHQIGYLPQDLADPDEDIPLAFMMHEVSHVLHSDLSVVQDEFKDDTSFHSLLNAIEDIRVNEIIMRTHVGSALQIRKLYRSKFVVSEDEFEEASLRMQSYPLHLQFGYGLLYEWFMHQPDPRIADSRVIKLLEDCKADIEKAYKATSPKESFEIIQDRIWPKYKTIADVSKAESVEQELARNAGDLQKIVPTSAKESTKFNQTSRSDKTADGTDVSNTLSPEMKDEIRKKVSNLFKAAEKEFSEALRGKMLPAPLKAETSSEEREYAVQFAEGKQQLKQMDRDARRRELTKQHHTETSARVQEILKDTQLQREGITRQQDQIYNSYREPVRLYISSLVHQLKTVFKDVTHQRMIGDRAAGDLSQTSLAIIPTGTDRLFEKALAPHEFTCNISILVDESDSMQDDERYRRAIEGVVLIQEALAQIGGVSFEIAGFNANPYLPHKAFEERLTKRKAVEIVQAIHQNIGGSTADAEALEQALKRIQNRRGKSFVIILTDGNPNKSTNRTDLESVIGKARNTRVFALGIGGSTLVEKVYPTGFSVNGLAEVPQKIAAIFRRELRK